MLFAVALLASCSKPDDPTIWDNATYKEDTTLGNGEKTVVVEVAVLENLVTFTINTNADTVGAALAEHNLIDGEPGAYGMYVKTVNGITADYDKDQRYWALYVDGEYATMGVDLTEIEEGRVYRIEYAK